MRNGAAVVCKTMHAYREIFSTSTRDNGAETHVVIEQHHRNMAYTLLEHEHWQTLKAAFAEKGSTIEAITFGRSKDKP